VGMCSSDVMAVEVTSFLEPSRAQGSRPAPAARPQSHHLSSHRRQRVSDSNRAVPHDTFYTLFIFMAQPVL